MIRIKRTAEAEEAITAARESHRQAQRDLVAQQDNLTVSRRAVDKLRAHNAANHWDEWLMRLVLGRAR